MGEKFAAEKPRRWAAIESHPALPEFDDTEIAQSCDLRVEYLMSGFARHGDYAFRRALAFLGLAVLALRALALPPARLDAVAFCVAGPTMR